MAALLTHPLRRVSTLFSPDRGVDNLSLLIGLRWAAIVGQLSAVLVAAGPVDIALPVAPLLAVIAALAAFNLFSQRVLRPRYRSGRGSADGLMLCELLVDVAALTLLLYWSGGADNPFIGLFLLPLSIGAAVLPAAHVAGLLVVSVGAFAALHVFNVPIAWPAWTGRRLQMTGSALSFVLSAALIALFVARMTASLRERDRLLAREREAKLRDQQIVALGTLATGALHELGTPLSTISVLVDGLLETEHEPELVEDLRLIANQVGACKRTLSQLAAQSGAARGERVRAVPLAGWLDETVSRWRALQPRTEIRWQRALPLESVQVVVDETLRQALVSLLNNAAQFSPARVDAAARLEGDSLVIEIRDYGPGIPEAIAAHAGRARRTTRDDGMGLGLFLAHATVERFGGCIGLENHPDGGLVIRMAVPLARWRV